jgi:3-oxoadipate enol-lactonase
MPELELDPTLRMHYEDDYFGDPWLRPEPVLMIHGVAESGRAWFAWVPRFARSFRVLRPDLRGFGGSSVPPAGYHWTAEAFAGDLNGFLEAVHVPAAHVVSAKLGGSIAMQFAADYPARVLSLSVISSPVRAHNTGGSADLGAFADIVRDKGVRGWAAKTQRARLGSDARQTQVDWWTDFMAQSDPRVVTEVTAMAGNLDVSAALPKIQAPSLIVTTEKSALASVEVVREWQRSIPQSELQVLPGDSYHVAAAQPDACANLVLEFIGRHSRGL